MWILVASALFGAMYGGADAIAELAVKEAGEPAQLQVHGLPALSSALCYQRPRTAPFLLATSLCQA